MSDIPLPYQQALKIAYNNGYHHQNFWTRWNDGPGRVSGAAPTIRFPEWQKYFFKNNEDAEEFGVTSYPMEYIQNYIDKHYKHMSDGL